MFNIDVIVVVGVYAKHKMNGGLIRASSPYEVS